MKSYLIVFLFALVWAQQIESADDLSSLTTKFQSLINELGEAGELSRNDYKEEITTMLEKLERFQARPHTGNGSLALEWFSSSLLQGVPMRVVLVASSFEGMYLNSGIGTFYASLADFLLNHGHIVTILYTRTDRSNAAISNFNRWQKNFAKRGIAVVKLPPSTVTISALSHTEVSYRVYQYLTEQQQNIDIVHFPEYEGPGFFSMLSKHQGISFSATLFVVGLHGPWRWVKHGNQDPAVIQEDEVEQDWLERKSVELADVVITPSKDLPQWLALQGWPLPEASRLYLMPFLPGREIQLVNQRRQADFDENVNVRELVFFGRLETRKGLAMFADALDILSSNVKVPSDLKVTFLGRDVDMNGQPATSYLTERAKAGGWPFQASYLTHKDRKGALEYLLERGRGRVAVISSVVDNAPYTIYECLYARIPFIATDLPSIAALVHPEDRSRALFQPDVTSLANKLKLLTETGTSLCRGLVSVEQSVKSWESLYYKMSSLVKTLKSSMPETPPSYLPKVSVCITHFNRPKLLPMAIQSVLDQSFPLKNIEVILVDDGSTDPAAILYVDSLQPTFDTYGWKIIRTENKYLGAARNTASRAATGDYLIFLDDDNIASPTQLATYVSVALKTGADLFTGVHDLFKGNGLPDQSNIIARSVPLGPAITVGVFRNCFGDANFFISREAFLRTGGFTEDAGVGQEDYEYLSKAVLSSLKLEAVPEVMLYYRQHNTSAQMMYTTDPVKSRARSSRPYASFLDEDAETADLLKILAHKRVTESLARATRTDQCNMSLISITPNTYNILTPTTLNFTAVQMDCEIAAVYIGKYNCDNVVLGDGFFSCLSPPIPFHNTYGISALFKEQAAPTNLDKFVEVTQANTTSSVSVILIEYLVKNSQYNFSALVEVFANLMDESPELFSFIDDLITGSARSKRAVLDTTQENHVTRFYVTSANSAYTAEAFANALTTVSLANPQSFAAKGVTLETIHIIANCDKRGYCSCSPLYAGASCEEAAGCAGNCTMNGDCVDGPFGPTCSCYAGYTGRDCQSQTCSNECSGHGFCRVAVGESPYCECNAGWNGTACSEATFVCSASTCSGSCVNNECVCPEGSDRTDCTIAPATYVVAEQSQTTPTDHNGDIALWVVLGFVGLLIVIIIVLALYVRRLRKN